MLISYATAFGGIRGVEGEKMLKKISKTFELFTLHHSRDDVHFKVVTLFRLESESRKVMLGIY